MAKATRLSEADRMRLEYNLVCGLANRALEPDDDDTPRPIARGSQFLFSGKKGRSDLDAAEELTLRLLNRVMERRGAPPGSDGGVAELSDALLRPLVALLAGLWAAHRANVARAPGDVHTGGELLDIDAPLSAAPGSDELAQELPWILDRASGRPHSDLIALLGPMPELESPATAYAIACYHSVLAVHDRPHLDRGFQALSIAVVDRSMRAWAPHDPWLASLRGAESRWNGLFGGADPTDEPETLDVNLTLVDRRPFDGT